MFKNLPIDVHNKRTIFKSIIKDIRNEEGRELDCFDVLVIPRKDKLQGLMKQKEHLKGEVLKARED